MEPAVRKEMPLTTLEFLVLAALQEEGAAHGYALAGTMEAQTEGAVRFRPGDLYRVLYRLSQRGLVQKDSSDGRRHYYRLTALGEKVLHAEADMLSGVIDLVRRSVKLRTS